MLFPWFRQGQLYSTSECGSHLSPSSRKKFPNLITMVIYFIVIVVVGSQFEAQAQQVWGLGPRGPITMNL